MLQTLKQRGKRSPCLQQGSQPELFLLPGQGRVSHLGQLVFGQDRPSLLVLRLQGENGMMETVLKDRRTRNQNWMGEVLLKDGRTRRTRGPVPWACRGAARKLGAPWAWGRAGAGWDSRCEDGDGPTLSLAPPCHRTEGSAPPHTGLMDPGSSPPETGGVAPCWSLAISPRATGSRPRGSQFPRYTSLTPPHGPGTPLHGLGTPRTGPDTPPRA